MFNFLLTLPFGKVNKEFLLPKLDLETTYQLKDNCILVNSSLSSLEYDDRFMLKNDKEVFYYKILEEKNMLEEQVENDIYLSDGEHFWKVLMTGKMVKK